MQLSSGQTRRNNGSRNLNGLILLAGAMSQVEAGRANGAGAGSSGCNRPLVEVLQQEVAKMGHDRDVLLKQLAQVRRTATGVCDMQASCKLQTVRLF